MPDPPLIEKKMRQTRRKLLRFIRLSVLNSEEVVNDESTFNYSSSSLPTSPPRKTAKEKHSGSPSHPGGSGGSFVIRTEKRDSETVLSVLAIRSVTERSFGLYRCKARSPVGYAEKDYTLSGEWAKLKRNFTQNFTPDFMQSFTLKFMQNFRPDFMHKFTPNFMQDFSSCFYKKNRSAQNAQNWT